MYTIYTKTTCSFCVAAKELLKDKQLEYVEKNIEIPKYRAELLSMYPDVKTVPQIYLEEKLIGGYDSLVNFFNQTI
jgi:glutaredoxin 3